MRSQNIVFRRLSYSLGVALFATATMVVFLRADGGTITACVNTHSGELKIVPNGTMCQNGHELLQWDQTGSVGPVGPAGPAGPSAAFSVQSRTEVDLPPTFTPILELAVPAGNYVVTAGVVVHNFSAPRETLAVLCTIGTPTESSLTYSARIDAFNSATAQGASSATIPLSVVTHLDSPGTVTLQCETNNLSRQMAFASSRHLTAVLVGSATRSEM